MLKSLNIENIAVIEKADIEFSGGLNVLTGETGAGKSIVVDSINAILGERTSKDLVRHGADNANVVARFENINSDVEAMLNDLGITPEEDKSLIISRKISNQGKSNCRINGVPCTVGMLKELGSKLVNIHGQHDSQQLLNSDMHYKFVDMLSDDKAIYDEYKKSFKNLVAVRKQLKKLTADADDKDKQLELLDTPGVLWPKFEDKTVGEHLAFTGAVTDRILDTEWLAMQLLSLLVAECPEKITARYGVELTDDSYELLCLIGKKRGMMIRGGETDTERAANMLLEEYRNCKIGNITLERAEK